MRIVLVCVAVIFAIVAYGCSCESEHIAFDLPAGQADVTLREFAKQAKAEIVYDAAMVRMVKTNGVRGAYTPEDALLRMLNDTGLIVECDSRTGAFAIVNGSQRARGDVRSRFQLAMNDRAIDRSMEDGSLAPSRLVAMLERILKNAFLCE